jgi:molybdate transport system substrate-binding protein
MVWHFPCNTKGRLHASKAEKEYLSVSGYRQPLRAFLLVLALLIIPPAGGVAQAGEKKIIRVSAAVSLTDALNAIKEVYSRKEPGVGLEFNLASSGLLQMQVEEGAPVDLFISAGKNQMDKLAGKGLVVPQTRSDLLGNELVLIVAKEKQSRIKSFTDLAKEAVSFTIGQPETVPAGKYGKETLVSLKLWGKLANRIVYAKDVRQVLTYVDSGNVDAGLVYRTDAIALRNAVIAAVAPKGSHSPIVYPMAAIVQGKNLDETKKFMAFLKTPEASRIFARFHFIPLHGGN